jgi:quercetin dioxygenase-like cupin family protein
MFAIMPNMSESKSRPFNRKVFEVEVKRKFEAQDLEVRVIKDGPGHEYPEHSHDAVQLAILDGSIEVGLDGEPLQVYYPGSVISIGDGQNHIARIGEDGCTYLFAATQDEMVRQGLVK